MHALLKTFAENLKKIDAKLEIIQILKGKQWLTIMKKNNKKANT